MTATKPKNIDEYIAGFSKDTQTILEHIRTTKEKVLSNFRLTSHFHQT